MREERQGGRRKKIEERRERSGEKAGRAKNTPGMGHTEILLSEFL